MHVCNDCHNLWRIFINLYDTAVLNINDIDYHCNINGISQNEALNLLKNADITEKSRIL